MKRNVIFRAVILTNSGSARRSAGNASAICASAGTIAEPVRGRRSARISNFLN